MPHTIYRRSPVVFSAFLALLLCSLTATAQDLRSTVDSETGINRAASVSQGRVTALAQQTADLLAEYRAVVRETDSLRIYNDNL